MIPIRDTIRSRSFPLVNWVIILANAAAFYYELRIGSSALNGFINTWGLVPTRFWAAPQSDWVTIFSSMFLHGGWFHILSNMWILFIFGDNVEDRMGSGRYLVFYLLSGVAAALTQAFFLPNSSSPMVGASGAIAGVLGAYLLLFPRARILSLVPIFFIFTLIEIPAIVFLLFWFASQLFSGFLSLGGASGSGVAWWAHIGGFTFGLLGAFLIARRGTTR
ncbi:MAG: rhomboid family intramembrane serine protease [Anaerolineales bacterium]|jgi:membrane associated rhomboid family serine protease